MSFKDHFSGHAADYRTFRPDYPPELFAYLAEQAPGHSLAWDCATGNGQAARLLKRHFRAVVATDASREQVEQAPPTAGITYRVAPAEQSGLERGSVDLVTVAQALHWFDLPRFFAEVRRVGRPGAVLACWSYALMQISPAIDELVWRWYAGPLDEFWPPERRLVEQGYRSLEFPFVELTPPQFAMRQTWTLGQVLGYLSTWSAVKAYEKARGRNPLELLANDLERQWGEPSIMREVHWPLAMRVGRV